MFLNLREQMVHSTILVTAGGVGSMSFEPNCKGGSAAGEKEFDFLTAASFSLLI
jgi:hypothetical protein